MLLTNFVEFCNSLYEIAKAFYNMTKEEKVEKVEEIIHKFNFLEKTVEEIKDIVRKVNLEGFEKYIKEKASKECVEALEKIKDYILMIVGYNEMGNVDLQVSHMFYPLEVEGARYYEMGATEGKNIATA